MVMRVRLSIFIAIVMVAVCGCNRQFHEGLPAGKDVGKPDISIQEENLKLENLSHLDIDVETRKLVHDFYSNRQPFMAVGTIRILAVKPYLEGYLVSTDLCSGIINSGISLLKLERNKDGYLYISEVAEGDSPARTGFSINRAECDGRTIVFGSFKDEMKPMDYTKLAVKLQYKNGAHRNKSLELRESVDGYKGYIVVADQICKIREFTLYSNDNKVKGSLMDLETDGKIVRNSTFVSYDDTIAYMGLVEIKNVNSNELTFNFDDHCQLRSSEGMKHRLIFPFDESSS